MIEFCTKKRMVIAILVLIGVSLIILILQSAWSTHRNHLAVKGLKKAGKLNNTCGTAQTKVVELCSACSKLELRMEIPVCQETGYKEKVQCSNKGKSFYRSCDISPDMDETYFWIFECVALVVSLVAFFVVRSRQKLLDKNLMDKIHRQIASGV